MYQNNISVPHSFFKKAKKEYRNWIMAIFRELIQNSYDAKAKNIDFTFREEEAHYILTCQDNGKGMTKDILINVLLCLGGSQKDIDSIGGFGYAKTLLFFSHDHYIIHSQDNYVEGIGGNYNYEKTSHFIDGTFIQVKIPVESENGRIYPFSFKDAITELLAFSKLPSIQITWNKEIQKTNKHSFEFNHQTPIGKLHFKDSKDNISILWVRIKGLAMFQHYVYSNNHAFLGILELDKNPIDVLTTNRDSLIGKAEAEFNQIFKTLQEERSSLKSSKIINFIINEKQFILQNETSSSNENIFNENTSQNNFQVSNNYQINKKPLIQMPEKATFNAFEKILVKSKKEIDKINSLFEQIDETKMPLNFVIQKSDDCLLPNFKIKQMIEQKGNVKLAHKWKKIIYSILQSNSHFSFVSQYGKIVDYQGQEGCFFYRERVVNIGFVFGDNSNAVNSSNKDSISILINPNNIKFNIDNNSLLDIAFHEVSHIFKDYHDESFISLEMDLKWKFRKYWNTQDIGKIGTIKL